MPPETKHLIRQRMKSTYLLTAATLFVTAANAQVTDSTTQNNNTGNTTATGTMSTTDTTRKLNNYGSYSTRDSIAAKYKLLPMPGALTPDKAFPILGAYQLNAGADATANTATSGTTSTDTASQSTDAMSAAPSVTITLDSASKGIVWVEGLQQGRLKAYLKKSPATYRILAQKTDAGKSIPEGTMHLDPTTNTLHIALGAPYNEADPTAVFAQGDVAATEENTATTTKANAKSKKAKQKVTIITATKFDATQQMQQGASTSIAQPVGQQ
jgi:hypothetical protein